MDGTRIAIDSAREAASRGASAVHAFVKAKGVAIAKMPQGRKLLLGAAVEAAVAVHTPLMGPIAGVFIGSAVGRWLGRNDR